MAGPARRRGRARLWSAWNSEASPTVSGRVLRSTHLLSHATRGEGEARQTCPRPLSARSPSPPGPAACSANTHPSFRVFAPTTPSQRDSLDSYRPKEETNPELIKQPKSLLNCKGKIWGETRKKKPGAETQDGLRPPSEQLIPVRAVEQLPVWKALGA